MSKIERKEYQETKIMRTLSPTRVRNGSAQNLAEFDNNLGKSNQIFYNLNKLKSNFQITFWMIYNRRFLEPITQATPTEKRGWSPTPIPRDPIH